MSSGPLRPPDLPHEVEPQCAGARIREVASTARAGSDHPQDALSLSVLDVRGSSRGAG